MEFAASSSISAIKLVTLYLGPMNLYGKSRHHRAIYGREKINAMMDDGSIKGISFGCVRFARGRLMK
jgi:hypothetical protein